MSLADQARPRVLHADVATCAGFVLYDELLA